LEIVKTVDQIDLPLCYRRRFRREAWLVEVDIRRRQRHSDYMVLPRTLISAGCIANNIDDSSGGFDDDTLL
jgi:hypothetical protein